MASVREIQTSETHAHGERIKTMMESEDNYQMIRKIIDGAPAEAGIERVQQWLDRHAEDVDAHYDLGSLYLTVGKIDNSLRCFQRCVDLKPGHTKYLKTLADTVYLKAKNTERALEIYQMILTSCPDDIDVLMIAGHLHVSIGQFDEAMQYYERIAGIDPSNKEVQMYIDKLNQRKNDPSAMKKPVAEYQKCHALLAQEKYDEALTCLESIVQDHPDFAVAHNDLGVLYYRLEDKERSLQCYQKAVAIEPENPNFRKNLADFYLIEQGRMEEAMEIYLAVLEQNPEDIDVLLVAGHICVAMGKQNSARTFYERVLDIEPWNFDAGDRLDQLNASP
jgi:tetratricopeptide (TPR) repeat protein